MIIATGTDAETDYSHADEEAALRLPPEFFRSNTEDEEFKAS